jgi:hypothetical protein
MSIAGHAAELEGFLITFAALLIGFRVQPGTEAGGNYMSGTG